MTVKQRQRKQIFWWLVAICMCFATVILCLTSCQLYQTSEGEDKAESGLPSTQQDAYEAKIVYYQAQIQNLTTQLTDMEQQMYLMREDYMTQLEALEQKMNASPNDSEETVPSDDTTDSSDQESNQSLPTGTPNQSKEDGVTSSDSSKQEEQFQVCKYTYRLENGCAILTSYLGDEEDVVVPAAVDGYLVVGIADRTFADCNMRSVTLPNTVKSMGWFTFYRCENLERVVLPSGLSSIGYASFDGCPSTLCLHVARDSYAEQFAISFGLRYQQMA